MRIKMTIRTITINDITEVDFDIDKTKPYVHLSEKFVWVKNKSPSDMYVSAIDENVTPGDDGTAGIASGECVMVKMPPGNIIYLSGNGDAEIYTSDVAVCPWEGGASGGGGGTPADVQPLTVSQMNSLLAKLND